MKGIVSLIEIRPTLAPALEPSVPSFRKPGRAQTAEVRGRGEECDGQTGPGGGAVLLRHQQGGLQGWLDQGESWQGRVVTSSILVMVVTVMVVMVVKVLSTCYRPNLLHK